MKKRRIRVTAKRKTGKITYLTEDRGKPGRTPDDEKWYKPGVETGWKKDMPEDKRRELVLKAHKGDLLASGRAMIALSNVTTDKETKEKSRKDGLYFIREHSNKHGRKPHQLVKRTVITPRQPRITPRTPRLE